MTTRSYTADSLKVLEDSHAALLACLDNLVERGLIRDPEGDHFEEAQAALTEAREAQKPAPSPMPDQIAVSWHIDDVREVRPDLTDDQCREVLAQAKHRHDAEIGINWDVLDAHADYLFPPQS